MNKFSKIAISFLSVFLCFIFVSACSSNKTTLAKIQEKYNTISSTNEEFFFGSRFYVTYNSDKLSNLIYSTNPDYDLYRTLKDSQNMGETDILSRGSYATLINAVCSTYQSYDIDAIFGTVRNNKETDKEYKVNMYDALEELEKDLSTLSKEKFSLESCFNNVSTTESILADDYITKNNLAKYKDALTNCVKDLWNFNNNLQMALTYNISPTSIGKDLSIQDILYNVAGLEITFDMNNKMINNSTLTITNFIIKYYIDVRQNIDYDKTLSQNLAKLLNLQRKISKESKNTDEARQNFKLIKMFENEIENLEKTFNSQIQNLTAENLKDADSKTISLIEDYETKLISYSNKLVSYLETL